MAEVTAAAAEWRRAQEALGAAEVCRDNGFYADAVSRSYYAIMHAAKAALPDNVKVDSHNGLLNQFSFYLVKEGPLEAPWPDYIRNSSAARIRADYNVGIVFTLADAQLSVDRAAAFLNRIHSLLGI